MEITTIKEHKVRHLSVAAYLHLLGHRIIRFAPVPGKQFSDIIFAYDSKLAADQAGYFEGAQVSALEYYEALTELKRSIQEARRNEQHNPPNSNQ
jgi:hypothetical protein